MKRIDFEHGTVTGNILGAALPMLVAQILNLLYNIVDRVYIARIPEVGTAALGAVGLCFPLIVIISAFANLFGTGGAPLFSIFRGKKEETKEYPHTFDGSRRSNSEDQAVLFNVSPQRQHISGSRCGTL